MGKASTKAHNKYNNKAYDRINFVVPKGEKEMIQAFAADRGESVNAFIRRAVLETMDREKLLAGKNTPLSECLGEEAVDL